MNKNGVFAAIRTAAAIHHLLTVGTVLCVAASVRPCSRRCCWHGWSIA